MVSKVEKSEATMDPMESNPPAKTDPFAHVVNRQLAAETGSADPSKRVLEGN